MNRRAQTSHFRDVQLLENLVLQKGSRPERCQQMMPQIPASHTFRDEQMIRLQAPLQGSSDYWSMYFILYL